MTMGSIVDDVVSVGTFGLIDTDFAGEEAQKASRRASGASVAAQERALDYLQEREALPQAYREAGLQGLGGEFGLTLDQEGNVISDGSTISERALTSPFYTTGRDVGEEAIMRRASVTGGLRSGNTQDALARANQSLYAQSYGQQLQGLQGMAQLSSNAGNIAQGMTNIGATQAQGIMAPAQIGMQADQNLMNAGLMGLGMLI
jgi:hypothetical protein